MDVKPDIEVLANDGVVVVKTRAHVSQEEHLVNEMKSVGQLIPGVKEIHTNVLPQFPEKDLY